MRKHPNSHREANSYCACSRLYSPFHQQRVWGIGWTSVVDLPLGSHSEFSGACKER
jgi:hypothetical protein